jgi:hypothetical protein
MTKRSELRQLYGPKVDGIPDGATIIEWEWPDGSGSWAWADTDEDISACIHEKRRNDCQVWTSLVEPEL